LQAAKTMGGELVDLVLTPWDAAGLAGPELLRALRRRSRNRNVPVVLLDAGLRQDTVVSAVKAGVAGRLVLPAEPAQLREILATIAAGGSPAGMARSR
jgi:CheY-like chemotaxis protein